MQANKLILTRHGETLENRENILQGHLPGTLSPLGIFQAEQLAIELQAAPIDRVVCSDLARSLDTALIAARPHGLTPVTTPLLREMDWGLHTGERLDDLDWHHLPESVESLEALYERAGRFIRWVAEQFPGACVLAVGHGAVNRAIVAFLEGRPPLDMLLMPIMENTGCLTFDF